MIALSIFDCKRGLAKKMPLNYIIVFVSTALMGVMVGVLCTNISTKIILFGILTTMLAVGGLSLYARTTERDFTGIRFWLTIVMMALFCFGTVMSKMFRATFFQLFGFYSMID